MTTDEDVSAEAPPRSVRIRKRILLEWPGRGSIPAGIYGPARHEVNLQGAVFVRTDEGLVGVKPGEFEWLDGDLDGAVCPLEGMVELVRFGGDAVAEWVAVFQLGAWIESAGWSLGPLQRDDPQGLLTQPGVQIAKWRHLLAEQRAALDGVVCWVGSPRHGTAVVFVRGPEL